MSKYVLLLCGLTAGVAVGFCPPGLQLAHRNTNVARKLCSRSTRDHGTAQAEIDCCDSYYARLADIRAGRTRSLELRITGNSGALRASKTADAPPSPAPPRPGSAEDGARTDSASSAVLQGTAGSLARYLQQQDMCGADCDSAEEVLKPSELEHADSLFARAEEAMQEGNTLAAKNFCYAAKVEYSKFPSVDAGRLDSVAAMEAKLALMW